MKKTLFIFVVILLSINGSFAQINLVQNPSFQDAIACPSYLMQIDSSLGWCSYRPSPEYFNKCAAYSSCVSIPKNCFGFQYTPNNTCNAYAGLYTNNINSYPVPGINYREYIGRQLSSPLIVGQKYYVSFKTSLADNSFYATDKLGVLFSTVPYSDINPAPIRNFAHVYSTLIISDTSENWTTISGSFVSDSAYSYIIIGNHFDDAHTDTIVLNSSYSGAYYYVTDFCVSLDSLFCDTFNFSCDTNTGIILSMIPNVNSFFPNPTTGLIYLRNTGPIDVKIFDISGKAFIAQHVSDKNYSFDISKFSNGIYFIQTIVNNKINYSKLLLNH
jgi:hypothetical protein